MFKGLRITAACSESVLFISIFGLSAVSFTDSSVRSEYIKDRCLYALSSSIFTIDYQYCHTLQPFEVSLHLIETYLIPLYTDISKTPGEIKYLANSIFLPECPF